MKVDPEGINNRENCSVWHWSSTRQQIFWFATCPVICEGVARLWILLWKDDDQQDEKRIF